MTQRAFVFAFALFAFVGCGSAAAEAPSAISTEAELVTLIGRDGCGDGALDLHRGHQPIQTVLDEVLGISHDDLHERMTERRQSLGAVATDLGVGAQRLTSALIDYFGAAIDTLLAAGTISTEKAAQYRSDLQQAIEFRVNWDGKQAPLALCTAKT